jgi:hypothetical protein
MRSKYPPDKASCGQTVLHDRVITTAVIVTDPLVAKYDVLTDSEVTGGTQASGDTAVADKELDSKIDERLKQIEKRHANVRDTLSTLPLAYEEWPSVLAGSCPKGFMTMGTFSHKASERGVGLAHAQIWQDWYYRNSEAEMAAMNVEEATLSGDSRSADSYNRDPRCGHTATVVPPAYRDLQSNAGGLSAYKNAQKQHSNDLLVVFEDDTISNIAPETLGPALIRELDAMQSSKTDLLFLGWCYGKGLRSMPMCAHAYVITRHMAKILLENWEPCGAAVDAQWHVRECLI